MITHINAKTPAATVIQSGDCQYSYKLLPHEGELRAIKEPNLATVRFNPKANDNSLPLNHRAIIVVIATIIDSAPKPNINLPADINQIFPVSAVTTEPSIINAVNIITDVFVPILSINNPPIRTMMIFGNE